VYLTGKWDYRWNIQLPWCMRQCPSYCKRPQSAWCPA